METKYVDLRRFLETQLNLSRHNSIIDDNDSIDHLYKTRQKAQGRIGGKQERKKER